MIGAILGDIIGSPHEFLGVKTKTFKLLDPEDNFITDDTLMTLAIAKAVLEAKKDFKLLSQKSKTIHARNWKPISSRLWYKI